MVLVFLARGSLGSKRFPAPRPHPVSNELYRFLCSLSEFKVAIEVENGRLSAAADSAKNAPQFSGALDGYKVMQPPAF